MATPTSSLATLRPELAGTMEQFDLAMDRLGFIGLRVLPVMEVAEQAGSFGKITLESLLRAADTTRTSKGGYNRDEFEFTTDTFATAENGFEGRVDDRDRRLYGNYFDAEQVTARRVFDIVLRNQEKRAAALLWNTTTWTGAEHTTAVSTAWTLANKATAVPVDDVEAAVRKVWALTGTWPNALILSHFAFRNLAHCSQIIDRITASGAGQPAKPSDVTTNMLAAVFNLPRIIVAGSAKNTANAGQTRSIASVWSNDYAMVARLAETNDIQEPCLGRTFHWGADGSQVGGLVETYRDETVRADIVRVRHETQEKVLYHEMAHLMTNVNGGTAS